MHRYHPPCQEPSTLRPGHNAPPALLPNGCMSAPPSAPGLPVRDRSGHYLLSLRASPPLPTSSASSLPTLQVAPAGVAAPTADAIPASVPAAHQPSTHGPPLRTNIWGRAGASRASATGHKATVGPSYPMNIFRLIFTTLPGSAGHSGLLFSWSSLQTPRMRAAPSAALVKPQRSTF